MLTGLCHGSRLLTNTLQYFGETSGKRVDFVNQSQAVTSNRINHWSRENVLIVSDLS